MVHDTHGHELLAVVAPVHHQRVGQALDDGTLGFAEAFHGVAAGGVGDVDGGADLDVISVFGGLDVSYCCWLGRRGGGTAGQKDGVMVLVDSRGVGDSRQADISDFDILVRPLIEELDGADLLRHFLGQDLVPAGILDLDFAVVRHGYGGRLCGIGGFESIGGEL